jgi:hypothetical protein
VTDWFYFPFSGEWNFPISKENSFESQVDK